MNFGIFPFISYDTNLLEFRLKSSEVDNLQSLIELRHMGFEVTFETEKRLIINGNYQAIAKLLWRELIAYHVWFRDFWKLAIKNKHEFSNPDQMKDEIKLVCMIGNIVDEITLNSIMEDLMDRFDIELFNYKFPEETVLM